jgi:hypothetical protein
MVDGLVGVIMIDVAGILRAAFIMLGARTTFQVSNSGSWIISSYYKLLPN